MDYKFVTELFNKIKKLDDTYPDYFELKDALLDDMSEDAGIFHLELMRDDSNKELRDDIRADFLERPNAEAILLKQKDLEADPTMQANILQLLGHLRSKYALPMAKDFLLHSDVNHREVALFVLGWVATKKEIALLTEHMLNEVEPELRSTAASAHRQIMYRLPDCKLELLKSLKKGFENEKNDEVLGWIIIMIENIAVKRLGILEDKDDPDKWHGDIEAARIKTRKFLSTITS